MAWTDWEAVMDGEPVLAFAHDVTVLKPIAKYAAHPPPPAAPPTNAANLATSARNRAISTAKDPQAHGIVTGHVHVAGGHEGQPGVTFSYWPWVTHQPW
jgi:hypothetical protein